MTSLIVAAGADIRLAGKAAVQAAADTPPGMDQSKQFSKLLEQHAQAFNVGPLERELGLPARVPADHVDSLHAFDGEIAKWEETLNTIGDDAQLANVDLQNILQKQQQTLQMMSNISKMLYDTAQSFARWAASGPGAFRATGRRRPAAACGRDSGRVRRRS